MNRLFLEEKNLLRSTLIFTFLFLPLQPETERRLLYNRKQRKEEIKAVIFQTKG